MPQEKAEGRHDTSYRKEMKLALSPTLDHKRREGMKSHCFTAFKTPSPLIQCFSKCLGFWSTSSIILLPLGGVGSKILEQIQLRNGEKHLSVKLEDRRVPCLRRTWTLEPENMDSICNPTINFHVILGKLLRLNSVNLLYKDVIRIKWTNIYRFFA